MIVVDTSASVAIFLAETDGDTFSDLIREADEPHISAASVAEALIVLDNRTGDDNGDLLRSLLFELGLLVEPVTGSEAWLAGEAYRRFGKGRHRARLNLGDCFTYALARILDLPLLFKGDDFRHTDLRAVL
ncbi:MAG: type II toxin-antitoxin system VapC family toxin [Phenylobacterium sp.]